MKIGYIGATTLVAERLAATLLSTRVTILHELFIIRVEVRNREGSLAAVIFRPKSTTALTRGRMIPFKLLSALAGIQWELLVAEVDGRVVGCGAYLGRKQMELTNLMVHPNYRRRGIGQALLVKRLQLLAEKGYPFTTTTILASNQASLVATPTTCMLIVLG